MIRTKKNIAVVLFLVSPSGGYCPITKGNSPIKNFVIAGFSELLPLPDKEQQTGLAGPCSGFVGREIIIAGGANFPDILPWEGDDKIYWNDNFTLSMDTREWKVSPGKSRDNFTDTYVYNPGLNTWKTLDTPEELSNPVMEGNAAPTAVNHIIFFNSADGKLSLPDRQPGKQVEGLTVSNTAGIFNGNLRVLTEMIVSPYDYQPVSSRDLLLYAFTDFTSNFSIGDFLSLFFMTEINAIYEYAIHKSQNKRRL